MDAPASNQLAQLASEYWTAALRFSPLHATAIGDRRFDDLMDDPTRDAARDHRTRLAGFSEQAAALDPASLDGEDRVTRSALVAQIARDIAELDADLAAWTVDPLEGPQVAALEIESFHSVATPAQARAMVARWNGLGPWFDAHAANLAGEVVSGRTPVRTPVEKALEQLDQTLAGWDEDLPLLAPLRVMHDDWPPDERRAFEDGIRTAVQTIIRPAYERYRSVVRERALPAARPDDRPGLMHVPGGDEAYERLIQAHTSVPLSAATIHQIGLDEVARIDDELAVLGARVLGTSEGAAIRARLRTDATLHFASRDEVFEKAESSLARARAALPDWFGILPQADCVVIRMAEFEEAHSTIAYYRQPAADGSRPGRYYINTSAPQTRPRYEAEPLAYHESIPGHHLQLAIAQQLTELPAFRRHTGPTAFIEGWGLYTERLADEMGLYSGDLDKIGVLSFDAWRACRLVVDTGMHALGWTRQQAIDFMTEHTALAENNIANEVDRYIVWPGQALAYKIGQREILRLRAEAKDRLGERFEIRGFHDAVLGHGAVGLETLGEIVREWANGSA